MPGQKESHGGTENTEREGIPQVGPSDVAGTPPGCGRFSGVPGSGGVASLNHRLHPSIPPGCVVGGARGRARSRRHPRPRTQGSAMPGQRGISRRHGEHGAGTNPASRTMRRGWHPSGMHFGVRPWTGALPASPAHRSLPAPRSPPPRVIGGSNPARATLLTSTRCLRAAGARSDKTGTVLLPSLERWGSGLPPQAAQEQGRTVLEPSMKRLRYPTNRLPSSENRKPSPSRPRQP